MDAFSRPQKSGSACFTQRGQKETSGREPGKGGGSRYSDVVMYLSCSAVHLNTCYLLALLTLILWFLLSSLNFSYLQFWFLLKNSFLRAKGGVRASVVHCPFPSLPSPIIRVRFGLLHLVPLDA